jgi:hypothetical protein
MSTTSPGSESGTLDATGFGGQPGPGDLRDLVRAGVDPAARAWLDAAVAGIRAPFDREAFTVAFTMAARRVGRAALPAGWSADEAARAALLLQGAAAQPAAAFAALVDDLYQHGDSRERQAILRTLAWLPAPERFLELAVEACRTSVQPVFEAIACENGYPAAHFPDLNFNQMVLKALFTGVSLRRIAGLRGRITGELRRMAAGYASERRAAGRSVPADIGVLLDDEEVRA